MNCLQKFFSTIIFYLQRFPYWDISNCVYICASACICVWKRCALRKQSALNKNSLHLTWNKHPGEHYLHANQQALLGSEQPSQAILQPDVLTTLGEKTLIAVLR
jgi:hypothetical protein